MKNKISTEKEVEIFLKKNDIEGGSLECNFGSPSSSFTNSSLKSAECFKQFNFIPVNRIIFEKRWHMNVIALYLNFLFRMDFFKDSCKQNAEKYLPSLIKEAKALCYIKHVNSQLGFGVAASKLIPADTCMGEYVGEFHMNHFFSGWSDTCYMIDYPLPLIKGFNIKINALNFGNFTRFINHSYQPNTCIKVAYDGVMFRLLVVSIEQIQGDEELRINYGKKYWEKRFLPA